MTLTAAELPSEAAARDSGEKREKKMAGGDEGEVDGRAKETKPCGLSIV